MGVVRVVRRGRSSVVLFSIVSITSLVIFSGFVRILSFACFSFLNFQSNSAGFLLGTTRPLGMFPFDLILLDAVVGCTLFVVVAALVVIILGVVFVEIVVEFSG